MNDRDRLLATALRDLCGWHVGMVTDDGYVIVDEGRTSEIEPGCSWGGAPACGYTRLHEYDLPDLNSPANRGHWLAWCWERDVHTDVVPQSTKGHYAIGVWPSGRHHVGPFATALLSALCESWTSLGLDEPPPSVLAWWKHEQALQMPVEPSYGVIMTAQGIAEQEVSDG